MKIVIVVACITGIAVIVVFALAAMAVIAAGSYQID